MIKEKLRRGTFLYKFYLYYHLFFRYKFFYRKKNYSQFKEDYFLADFFKEKTYGKFVDLGAFHPMKYNNTYLLYKKGWRGINIDLNDTSIDMFNIVRIKDENKCALISNKSDIKKTVYFEHNFSAVNSMTSSVGLKKKKIMISTTFDQLVKDRFDFLNIDLEGHDFEVLKVINLNKYSPKLICIEILDGSKNKDNIYNYMKKFRYEFIKQCNISYFFKNKDIF